MRGGVVVGLAALAVSLYAPLSLIPLAAAGLIALVLSKGRLIEDRLLLQAVSVQGGQAAMALIGSFVAVFFDHGYLHLEWILYASAVFLLAADPRKGIAVVLLVYQSFGLLVNARYLPFLPIGSLASRATVERMGLSSLAILLLVMLLRRGFPLVPDGKIAQVFE